ncbi:YopX family protein [Streptococcus constellatus]|uniref:YopX family protein n=1 Tax=Streptococcus constellatus TaxID=76860 RepID=UPI0028EDA729|nr:YopX family protein [Streptococcus constellatus]
MIPKFRAWDPHEKKMVDDTELVIWGGNIYQGNRQKIFERIVEGKKGLIGYSIDDKYLMQSTGLKDKNGTEIFEGDALKNNDYPNQTFICKHSRLQASFQAESLNGLLTLSLWKDEERDWQVLGNIYENPELAEADNDPE